VRTVLLGLSLPHPISHILSLLFIARETVTRLDSHLCESISHPPNIHTRPFLGQSMQHVRFFGAVTCFCLETEGSLPNGTSAMYSDCP
jgi:hypothetical protein